MCRLSSVIAIALVCALAPLAAHAQSCPNPAATPLAPPDHADNVPVTVTFQWSSVAGAQGYEVWAKFDGEGDFEELSGTSDTSDVEDIDPDTDVEWYVVTNFDSCRTESAHFHFHTVACGAATATPLSPPNGATSVTSPVTFSWAEAAGASAYRVWVSQGGDDFEVLDDTDQTSLTWRLPPGNYEWFVESFFDSCESTDSDSSFFTIARNPNCPSSPPALTAPVGGTSTSSVHFAWTGVPSAIGYEVWAALDDGDFEFVGDTSGATSLDADIGFGHVTWYVVAQFSGCDDLQSADAEFDIPYDPNCDHNATLLISPADGIDNVPPNTQFIWAPVDGATAYDVWAAYGDADPVVIGTTTSARFAATNLRPNAQVNWFIETKYASCPSDVSPENGFTTGSASQGCPPPAAPDVYIDSETMSGAAYSIIFDPGLNTASYEVDESTDPHFANARSVTTNDVLISFTKTVAVATRFYYRIRSASSCSNATGPFSDTVSIVVLPTATSSDNAAAATSYGSQNPVVQTIHITGSGGSISGKGRLASGATFSVTVDKPWLTVTPSSGTIPPEGLDLVVTADPKTLPVGTSSGTVRLTTTASDSGTAVPVSVNLVTPVTPNAGNTPLPTSLIIPAVAHVAGAGTDFQSDIRIANASAQTMKYQLNFTPSRADGTKVGQQSTITIDPGETAALNDIMKNFFGFAAAGDQVAGVLEIRPIANNGSSAAPNVTFASSRTFAAGPSGTYGQFVPAIPFAQFIGKAKSGTAPAFVSLQQVAQSPLYRTNVGLVEAAGEPATVNLDVFAHDGSKVTSFTINLLPGEHQQFPLGAYVPSLDDGRVEVSVTSATGKVTAYASVLDNKTNDPMLILPVNPATVSATRYVLPGVGDLQAGTGRWRSDVRLFNGGTSDAQVTIAYFKIGTSEASATKTLTIPARQVQVLDAALQSLFGISGEFGSFVVTTPATSSVVSTARTYFDTGSGTYGQFIPGLTPNDGAALGGRALQILQVEESDNFHTNVGVVELTGNPALVEIAATSPDNKVAAKTQVQLAGNEYRQFNSILKQLGFATTYNARVTLKVIAGSGRVSGYGSLIDNRTQDPTYVPAQ